MKLEKKLYRKVVKEIFFVIFVKLIKMIQFMFDFKLGLLGYSSF